MSRSGYEDELGTWDLIRWRGAVASAIRGKRGQQLLRDMVDALDSMPDKRLITGALEHDGGYCALGAVGAARGLPVGQLDPGDSEQIAAAFDVAEALAKEIVFRNDELGVWDETPEGRWKRMRVWAAANLTQEGE